MCTAAICLVIGGSVFTTRRMIQTEARRTRNSLPVLLNNSVDGGESLITRVDNINASLSALNKRLARLEEIVSRETREGSDDIRKVNNELRAELGRLSGKVDEVANEQRRLKDVPSQLNLVRSGLNTLADVVETGASTDAAPAEEVIQALDWMVQKIEDIDSYFPPLYQFLGAVYTGDGVTIGDYPSVDLRLNEVILNLDKVREDAEAIRKLVTPYVIETGKRPRPFEMDENQPAERITPLRK